MVRIIWSRFGGCKAEELGFRLSSALEGLGAQRLRATPAMAFSWQHAETPEPQNKKRNCRLQLKLGVLGFGALSPKP